MRRRPSRLSQSKLAQWGSDQKLQACACYVMLGNIREVALATDIPFATLMLWKQQDWWKELILQIRDEDVQKLDSNLQRIVTKSLKVVEDRLDKGDFQYDPKTGKVMRIPIKANIALRVTTELLTKQEKLRLDPIKMEVEKTIDARLAKLAEEFSRFSRSKDVTPIQELLDHKPVKAEEPIVEPPKPIVYSEVMTS